MTDLANLDTVIITGDLVERPVRKTDLGAENHALADLAREMASPSGSILQKTADTALELCDAHSAVLSLADDDHQGFTWHVVAGQWSDYHGHRMPRDASPDGIVHDRDAAQLFVRPERCFAALTLTRSHAEEALVVPIDAAGHAAGTLWVVSHDPNRRFDAEDLRIAMTLAAFAAAAIVAARPPHDREREELAAALREADRRKDIFLATLAHELRNPLAPVMNSLEIMRRAGGEPLILRDAIATMQRQMTQMVRMVDDLVDVSRITRDELELRKDRIPLASVITGAVEACQPQATALEHDVRVELPTAPIFVNADPARLMQVFGNLLNNACKFTDRHGTIVVSACRVGGDVEVSVKDSGVGIAADHLSEVFEMFAHVDRATGHPQAGLGIGLHLVKKLVEMHGGSVSAMSAGRGHGSEFLVRLPILADETKATSARRRQAEARPATPRRRILVVDDNQDAATSLAVLLKVTGHETEMASDGVEALQKASIYRPDVILLDISLPRMDGYDTCRAMRKQSWGRNAVIVALTGWGQEEDRSKSESAGFNGHFVKPVDHAELMRFLTETTAG
jgi:signal transduction histidine kinase/ActR/RegA family two-component response regulator